MVECLNGMKPVSGAVFLAKKQTTVPFLRLENKLIRFPSSAPIQKPPSGGFLLSFSGTRSVNRESLQNSKNTGDPRSETKVSSEDDYEK